MPDLASSAEPARLDAIFFALSDARRRDMIERLSEGALSVKEIAGPLHLALPSAVKHLGVLEDARIVHSEKTGRVRTFRLSPTAFRDVEKWVAERKRVLNLQFDRLDEFLARSEGDETEEPDAQR
ncbi:ArsR/SmtB family transcription factor [Roseibium salinum]|uniref:Metalloregulator ArsR/SmtB family transcription factor n=1 Tax=Roseibium salinum TaxID=1604349 RepID=A0ABT3QY08_9HYPH|nr:metalloregulator ArsR/SmtB family transcription factor [Roseibium sp. DSM 29163]MCX2721795.1 metalloregulator ArsR/SmtB family transcription factor [Roseibium sp. DSM 29163]